MVCTDADGRYSFDFVAYGAAWKVGANTGGCFGDTTNYGKEFWQETRHWESATALVLSASAPQYNGIDFTLEPAGTISGTVRDVAGNPIIGTSIGVNVEGADSEGLPSDQILEHACTNPATGQYTVANVPLDAPMFVWAGDNWCDHHIFGQEWWEHAFLPWNSTSITLTGGARDVTGIDFTLGTNVTASTPAGPGVSITPFAGLTLTFGSVTQGGVTTAISTADNLADTPSGFQMNGAIYEISTSAVFTTAQVCLNYNDAGLTATQESQLKLYHGHNASWVDVTDPGYPDVVANLICGTVSSFSPFAILLPLNTPASNVVVTTPPDPQLIGTSVPVSATFVDPDDGDAHTALWDWGDGTSDLVDAAGLTADATHAYTVPGVYTISVTITDEAGATASATSPFVVVYDPDGGFVTGGGWINSPAGAYAANPALAGKATFGFVSKYKKGANVPSGNTEFQFRVADFNFSSTSYDWLVVAGAKAQYKGSGTINGAGDYAFMLSAIDGQVSGGGGIDKFRIKIWDKGSGGVVYDNQMEAGDNADPTTALQGGSIVVHK